MERLLLAEKMWDSVHWQKLILDWILTGDLRFERLFSLQVNRTSAKDVM
jgi:hypothetical protein